MAFMDVETSTFLVLEEGLDLETFFVPIASFAGQFEIGDQEDGFLKTFLPPANDGHRAVCLVSELDTGKDDAITATGYSKTLLDRLSTLKAEETSLLTRRAELETAAVQPIPPIDLDQLPAVIETLIANPAPEILRPILHGFIDHIEVQRTGNELHGFVYYYYPPRPKKSPSPA